MPMIQGGRVMRGGHWKILLTHLCPPWTSSKRLVDFPYKTGQISYFHLVDGLDRLLCFEIGTKTGCKITSDWTLASARLACTPMGFLMSLLWVPTTLAFLALAVLDDLERIHEIQWSILGDNMDILGPVWASATNSDRMSPHCGQLVH